MVRYSKTKDGISALFDPPVEVLFQPFEFVKWIALPQIPGDNNKPWNIFADFIGDYVLLDSIEYGVIYVLTEEQQ